MNNSKSTGNSSNNSFNISKQINGIGNALKNVTATVSNTVKNTINTKNSSNIKPNSNSSIPSSTSLNDFAEKNSTISKFIFILFVFVIFIVLLRIGSYIITLLFTPSESPIVLNGMVSGTSYMKVQVNPTKDDPKPIYRSINEDQGMEFTWNTWVYIDNIFNDSNSIMKSRRIFTKGGNEDIDHDIILGTEKLHNELLNVSPGLFLKPNENTLVFVLNTFDESSATYETDIPYETV